MLVSGNDILNQGGTIAGGDVLLAAARDVRNESLASTQAYSSVNTNGSYTALSNQASIVASGALQISAGRDITDVAGHITAANASLSAGRDVNFNALATGSTYTAQVGQDAQNNLTVGHALTQLNTTGDLVVSAGRDLTLSGAQLNIGGDGALLAGRSLTVASVMDQVKTDQHGDVSAKNYEKLAADNQTVVGSNVGAGGALQLSAGLTQTAALTVTSSALAAGGALALNATGDVNIGGVQEVHVRDDASHHEASSTFTKSSSASVDYVASSTLVGSSLNAGSVSVKAGNDVVITGSALTAQDALTVVAGRDLVVTSGQQTVDESHSAESKKSGFSLTTYGVGYTASAEQQNGTTQSTTQLGSTLSGGTVTAVAGRDLNIVASNVVADGAVVLAATRDVNIVSAQNTVDSTSGSSSKQSGSIGTFLQPAIGTVKSTGQGTSGSVTQAGSQVASLGGDVTIQAGERYTQTASNVLAPAGDITIVAKDVQITAGYDTATSNSTTTFSKTAIGGTVSVPIVSAVQGIAALASAAKDAGSDRMTALAAVTAGMQAADAYAGVTAAGKPVGIKVGVSLGNSKSESAVVQSSRTAVGSQVKAGGDVTIVATGGGAGSNIASIGSDISGGGNVTLIADNQINLLAAENTSSQHSTNSSSGASIGLAYNIGETENGFSLELAANRANGKADGDTLSYGNSHVSAGSTVTLQSGGDTNIKGGVVSGAGVVANVGGDLNIQSLQDQAVYDSKQNSAGFSASICIPPFCYGASSVSGNVSKASVNGDYRSVVEQSGIKAGDGGFQLVVHGNTDLVGGVISSSQAAIDQGKNTLATGSLATGSLTYTALQNKDVYEADSFAMSGTVSGKFGDQTTAKSAADQKAAAGKAAPSASGGIGHDSGSQSSTTASGISAGTLTITDASRQAATGTTAEQALAGIVTGVTTETAASQAGALTQAWNGAALMKEVQAQTQITQAFSAQAPKAIADYATKRQDEIKAELVNHPGDEALISELSKWEEGGTYRVALHALSGALSGGADAALGALAVAGVAKPLDMLQAEMAASLTQEGMSPEVARIAAQAIAQATSLGIGSIVGGNAGAATAISVDTNNRQLHPDEKAKIKQLAGGDPLEEARLTAAACALVKCYAEYPEASSSYVQLKQLANIGSGSAYASEQQILSKQVDMFNYTSGSMFYDDEKIDRIKQVDNTYQLMTRTFGAGKVVLGGAGLVGTLITAPASCATGVGCFASAAAGTISFDAAYSGAKQVVSGSAENTFLNQGLQSLGMSQNAAGWVEAGLGIGFAATASNFASQTADQAISVSKLSAGTYQYFITGGIKPTAQVMQTPQAQALINEIMAGSPGMALAKAELYAAAYISSGEALPQMGIAAAGATLIKVVPKGAVVSETSGFWMTQQQAQAIATITPQQAGQVLGLPAAQAAKMLQEGLDYYSISVKTGSTAKVFVSEVAATSQGAVKSPGGAQQVIVPNRADWTPAILVSSQYKGK